MFIANGDCFSRPSSTAPWYRYFDATAHAEFLYRCVETTVRRDLPYEVAFLLAHDRFVAGMSDLVDMPSSRIDLLHKFLLQNDGRLSSRAREKEFRLLGDEEVARIEALFAESTAGLPPAPAASPPDDDRTGGTDES